MYRSSRLHRCGEARQRKKSWSAKPLTKFKKNNKKKKLSLRRLNYNKVAGGPPGGRESWSGIYFYHIRITRLRNYTITRSLLSYNTYERYKYQPYLLFVYLIFNFLTKKPKRNSPSFFFIILLKQTKQKRTAPS